MTDSLGVPGGDKRQWRVIVRMKDPERPVACVQLHEDRFLLPDEEVVNVVPISRLEEVERERDLFRRLHTEALDAITEATRRLRAMRVPDAQ